MICQQHWHQGVGGTDFIMESPNPKIVWAGRDLKEHLVPSPPARNRDIFHFHTLWCDAGALRCAEMIPCGNCLAGISCQPCRGSPTQGRRILSVLEHRVCRGAAAGKQSQGCCSSQYPTVVVELRVLGKPLHREFHPLMGIVPRKSFADGNSLSAFC